MRTRKIIATLVLLCSSQIVGIGNSYAVECPQSWNLIQPTLVVQNPTKGYTDLGLGGSGKFDGFGVQVGIVSDSLETKDSAGNPTMSTQLQPYKNQLGGNLVISSLTYQSQDKVNWSVSKLQLNTNGLQTWPNYYALNLGLSGVFIKQVWTIQMSSCSPFVIESKYAQLPEISTNPVGIDFALKDLTDRGFLPFTKIDALKQSYSKFLADLNARDWAKNQEFPYLQGSNFGSLASYFDPNRCVNSNDGYITQKVASCQVTIFLANQYPVDTVTLKANLATSNSPKNGDASTSVSLKTITCIKGKTLKRISAVNPKCPAGFKKK